MDNRRELVKRMILPLTVLLLFFIYFVESDGEKAEWVRPQEEVQSFTEGFVSRAKLGDLVFVETKEKEMGIYRIKNVSQRRTVFTTSSIFLWGGNRTFSETELANIYGRGGVIYLVPEERADEVSRELMFLGKDFAYR